MKASEIKEVMQAQFAANNVKRGFATYNVARGKFQVINENEKKFVKLPAFVIFQEVIFYSFQIENGVIVEMNN